MSDKFEKFTCWTEKTAGEAGFHTMGAQNMVDDAMVLATKVDIPISPSGSGEILSINEFIAGFISNFDVDGSNTVYAITGDSGSGKTFLIRCAQSQVDKDSRAHVVYVPRDVSSLHGILKLILKGLPGTAAAQALAEVESANVEELDIELLLKLVHAQIVVELAQGHGLNFLSDDESLTDLEKLALVQIYGEKDGNVYRRGIAEYLGHPDVAKHLLRKDGALWKQVLAMRGDFKDDLDPITESEILSLTHSKTKTLELENFLFYFKENKTLVARVVETVRVAALAAQVRTSRDLTEIVEEAREILNLQDKQLVLMFEDIARNGVGLSDAVFDLFRAAGIKNLKPIRVMFATTGGYWSQIPANVRNTCRRFEVRNLTVGDLRTRQIGLEIISKYLNVARLGKDSVLEEWSKSDLSERASGEWVPNKCEACPHKPVCHAEFGDVNGIGLYPLNVKTAENVLTHLEEINSNPGFSPRLIVRMLIAEWLRNSEPALKTGKFPTAQIEEIIGSRVSIAHIEGSTTGPERARFSQEMIERVFRARVAWANHDTTGDHISTELATAFGLEIESGKTVESVSPTQPESPLGDSNLGHPLNQEKRFITEVTDIAEWANALDKPPMPPGRVEALRVFLVGLVKQSLRLDRYLIRYGVRQTPNGRPGEIKSLVEGYLQEVSVRIEGGKGDESNALRMQKRIERSGDSYLLLAAALWFLKTGTWESEYKDGQIVWKCDTRINVRGRQLLFDWVDEFANEVNSRIRDEVRDASEVNLLAQIRLLSLVEPSFLDVSNENLIARLNTLGGNDGVLNSDFCSTELGQLLTEFDSFDAETLTAYQEDGDTRLAEDLVAKHRLLNVFRDGPDWRSKLSMKDSSRLVVLDQRVGDFSVELASMLHNGELSLSAFKNEIQKIDLLELKNQLEDFNQVFESLVSRMHTSQQPVEVRDVIQVVRMGIQRIVEEKELLLESLQVSEQLSDPQIWQLMEKFPFLSNWTLKYQDLKRIVHEIHAELEQRVGNQVLPDVVTLKSQLKTSLDSILIPDKGVDGVC
jgi:energy-coupling factor transporter ATP-binding protein EcfA2